MTYDNRNMRLRSEFWAGARAELPVMLGAVPFGVIYGVSAVKAGISPILAQAMSAIIFAGSAQFVTVQLVSAATPGLIIVLAGFVVNLRHMLYSASVAPYLRGVSRGWKAVLAYLLTDEAYAIAITHFQRRDEAAETHDEPVSEEEQQRKNGRYLLGAGLALWSAWQASSAVGVFLGSAVPSDWPLDFALPLTFIALLVPALRDRPSAAAAIAAGLIAVPAAGLPLKLGLIAATFCGIAAGLLVRRKQSDRA